ncbi:ChbG/HpnK family deacetylase [Lactiplantibacillus plantarum]|nr:ChbG/HpnK family deacetylase [Lactiplantibacillus plantarum]
MERKVIVRADDLGYSDAVNVGIARTVHNGLINNVGVMVNMPTTMSGLAMIKDAGVYLGLHTVISAGRPLTNPKLIPSITNPDGTFRHSSDYRAAIHDFVDLNEVVLEIEAQYQKFVALVGRQPDYFEGHAVVSDNFVKGLEIVGERHHLNLLRFAAGPDSPSVLFKGKVLHVFMESMGKNYNPYETLKRAALAQYNDGYAMMVCHPGYLDDYLLQHSSLTVPRTQEVAMLTDSQMQEWLERQQIKLIKYSEV